MIFNLLFRYDTQNGHEKQGKNALLDRNYLTTKRLWIEELQNFLARSWLINRQLIFYFTMSFWIILVLQIISTAGKRNP